MSADYADFDDYETSSEFDGEAGRYRRRRGRRAKFVEAPKVEPPVVVEAPPPVAPAPEPEPTPVERLGIVGRPGPRNVSPEITMCYIDVRTPGRLEDFSVKAQAEHKITMLKGKVAKVTEDAAGTVTVEVEDVLGGTRRHLAADLVVLATGMSPAKKGLPGVAYDENGFATGAAGTVPVFAVGCAKKPVDVAGAVQDATGVALKAIQALVRS